jgi:hypothetical protein
MIRHARSAPAMPVSALAITVVQTSFGALLVTPVGRTALMQAGVFAAAGAAITLAAITVRAEEEHGVTLRADANPQSENDFARGRHAVRRRALDNDGPGVSV